MRQHLKITIALIGLAYLDGLPIQFLMADTLYADSVVDDTNHLHIIGVVRLTFLISSSRPNDLDRCASSDQDANGRVRGGQPNRFFISVIDDTGVGSSPLSMAI